MRRLVLPIATAALLALAALVVLELLQPGVPLTQAEQADRIAAELRCPDCQSLSVAESQTAAAAAIRTKIVELLEAGASAQEVRNHFVDRYGEWILLNPVSPMARWLPFAVLLAGVGLFAWWLRRSATGGEPPAAPPPGDAATRRVRDEVEQLDA